MSNNDTRKLREFWLIGKEVYYCEQDTGILRAPEQIHVIEYGAYEVVERNLTSTQALLWSFEEHDKMKSQTIEALHKECDEYRAALEYYSLGLSPGQGSKEDVQLVPKPPQQINIQRIMADNNGELPASAYINTDEPLKLYGKLAREVLAKYSKESR